MSHDLHAALSPRINERIEADPAPNAMLASGIVIDELRQLLAQISLPPKAEVVESVGRIYDELIRPIDIPMVPNIGVEPMVDNAVKAGLLALTEKVYDHIAEAV